MNKNKCTVQRFEKLTFLLFAKMSNSMIELIYVLHKNVKKFPANIYDCSYGRLLSTANNKRMRIKISIYFRKCWNIKFL